LELPGGKGGVVPAYSGPKRGGGSLEKRTCVGKIDDLRQELRGKGGFVKKQSQSGTEERKCSWGFEKLALNV